MTAPVVPDAGQDPAGYVLAAADLREKRIKAATAGPYVVHRLHTPAESAYQIHAGPTEVVWLYVGAEPQDQADAEHIAAEANPEHARTEVALWRLTATKHRAEDGMFPPTCAGCPPVIEYDEDTDGETEWLPLAPCEFLLAVVAAARAYLTGAGG